VYAFALICAFHMYYTCTLLLCSTRSIILTELSLNGKIVQRTIIYVESNLYILTCTGILKISTCDTVKKINRLKAALK